MVNLMVFLILVAIGGMLFKSGLVPLQFFRKTESYIIKVIFPCFIFLGIYDNQINFDLAERHFLYSYLLSLLMVFSIAYWLYRKETLAIQIIRSYASISINTIFFSIPIVTFYLKDPSSALIINIFQPLVLLPLIIVSLNLVNGRHQLGDFFRNFYSVSILISVTLGFLCLGFKLVLPYFVIDGLTFLSRLVLILAPICFGANIFALDRQEFLNTNYHLHGLLLKLLFIPLLALSIGYFIFHLDRYWLVSLYLIGASPTGLFIPIIAQEFSIIPDKIRTFLILSSFGSLVLVSLSLALLEMINL